MEILGKFRPRSSAIEHRFLLGEVKSSFHRYIHTSFSTLLCPFCSSCFYGPNFKSRRSLTNQLSIRSMPQPTIPEVSRRRWVLKSSVIGPPEACAVSAGCADTSFVFLPRHISEHTVEVCMFHALSSVHAIIRTSEPIQIKLVFYWW